MASFQPSRMFLYSQDLSNYKTSCAILLESTLFLYSQDLSNYKTLVGQQHVRFTFLYSQDLSNYKTEGATLNDIQCFCTLKI